LAGSVYSGNVLVGSGHDNTDIKSGKSYNWSFTTDVPSDVTPPTVVSVAPANSGTSVAVTSNATAVFSESMNAGLMTTSTLALYE
jgi:hypothetical protein